MPHPAPKPQASGTEEIEKLRHRIGAILRVQQRVGQAGFVAEVGRIAQQRLQRMVWRQRLQAGSEFANLGRSGADAEPAAVVLQQVDPGAAIGRVHHQVHGAIGCQDVVQRPQSLVGVGR